MSLKEIRSHGQMLELLSPDSRTFVLLYKKGSDTSECSYNNIQQALSSGVDANVAAVNVSEVRDIHPNYNVSTVPTLLVFKGDKFEKTIKGCNDDGYYTSLFNSVVFTASKSDRGNQQNRVTVYSTPSCSWCTTLKNHFKKNGIRYSEIDVSKDEKASQQMQRKSGKQGVPQTEINGKMIVGFDKSKIDSLLNIQ